MKNFIILFAVLIFNSNALFSQSYKEVSLIADSLYSAKIYLKAGKEYDRAANLAWLKTIKKRYYYNAACSYSLAKKMDLAFRSLNLAVDNGFSDKTRVSKDIDLSYLHKDKRWNSLINAIVPKLSSSNPLSPKLVTSDIQNFYKAFDIAIKNPKDASKIFKENYLINGSVGLQDFFAYKVRDIDSFGAHVIKNKSFYKDIRSTVLKVENFKGDIHGYFTEFKTLYPEAVFPDVYFVISDLMSGGTKTNNGLLINSSVKSKTKKNSINWDKQTLEWTSDFFKTPVTVIHESVHFNQEGMANEKTLLKYAMIEGSAEFITELITGQSDVMRFFTEFIGKEKLIWKDFKKDMYDDKYMEWMLPQEGKRPMSAMYWVGYIICKSYYNEAKGKSKSEVINEILNIKDYKAFYKKSNADKYINENF
ncbi:TPR end-of-group domain-containing protein [Pontimicrobium aquaticum]|uniref:DUF2268 domain-containing protein n=1 Tax=Pontimicrobium aquaticum TaxID=2565367 RepID=A0A4U0F1Y1_9FLAO|nr:DUF2268 domain-containing putative Zn-dependent protease [Pontimicrobium aquaticum]TJY37784.1 hypothetical protein E5167_00590 [Pontimicrobium aquaticum]